MGLQTILFVICLSLAPTADNQEKVQKEEFEAKVKTITAEAQKLEQLHQAVCLLSGLGRCKARYGRNERQ
jgi:hypothetical protein